MTRSLKTDRKRRQSLPAKIGSEKNIHGQNEKRRNSLGEVNSALSPFISAFATYGHLICYNYPEQAHSRRQKCAKILFDAFIKDALQRIDQKQQSTNSDTFSRPNRLQRFLSSCLKSFGLADPFLRQQLAIVLERTCKVSILSKPWIHTSRKMLLEFLPLTFPIEQVDEMAGGSEMTHNETSFESILKLVHELLHDNHISRHMTIMKPLNQLPFSIDHRTSIREIIMDVMSKNCTEDREIVDLASTLFEFCDTRSDVFQAIDFTRMIWRKREEKLNENTLLTIFKLALMLWEADSNPEENKSVQKRYSILLDSFKQARGDDDTCLVLDMVFLFSSGDMDESNNIDLMISCWLSAETSPLDAGLRSLCQVIESTSRDIIFEKAFEYRDLLHRLYQCIDNFVHRVVFSVPWSEASIQEKVIRCIGTLLSSLPTRLRRSCFRSIATKFNTSQVPTSRDPSSHVLKDTKLLHQAGHFLRHVARNSLVVEDCWPLRTFTNVLLASDSTTKDTLETACICLAACPTYYDETLSLLQTLLFHGFSQLQLKFAERGLLIATELLRAKQLGEAQLKLVQCLLQKYLLPPQRRMIEPELGPQALACINCLQSSGPTRSSAFRMFKAILSNTGLIQSSSHFAKRRCRSYLSQLSAPVSVAGTDGTATGQHYNETVFCVAYFFRHLDSVFERDDKFDRSEAITDWVFHLVDAYLSSGREKTRNWKATVWLNSAIEFPKLNHDDSTLCKTLLDKLNLMSISKTQNLDLVPQSLERLWQKIPLEAARDMVVALSTLCLSLLTASVIRSAVINHAHEHLGSADNSQSETIFEIKSHIYSNVLELFNLRKKADIINSVAASLEAFLRKAIKQVAVNSDASSADRANRQNAVVTIKSNLYSMTKELSQAPKFVSTKVLWSCLYDSEQDDWVKKTLHSVLRGENKSTSEIVKFRRAINFKELLVEHLRQLSRGDKERHRRLNDCIESIVFWCDFFFVRKKDKEDRAVEVLPLQALSRMTISTILLVISVLNENDENEIVRARDSFAEAFAVKQGELLSNMCRLRRSSQDLEFADAILELASVLFSVGSNESRNIVLMESYQMIRHDQYSGSLSENGFKDVPFCVRQVHLRANSYRNTCPPCLGRIFDQLILENDESRGRKEKQLRFMLLRHFSLICLSNSRQVYFTEHIGEFTLELTSFLIRRPRNKRAMSGPESTLTTCKMMPDHSLSRTNFHIFWEALLHICVGACIMFKPEGRGTLSPYTSLVDIAGIFQRLLQAYIRNMNTFPRKSIVIAFRASRCMLEASRKVLEICVQWRNELSMPSGPEEPDFGSVMFLQGLVDALASRVCSSIFQLCDCWKNSKEVSLAAASKSRNLLVLADKFSTTLHDVANFHNLQTSPQFIETEKDLLVCSDKVARRPLNTIEKRRAKKKRRIALTTIGRATNWATAKSAAHHVNHDEKKAGKEDEGIHDESMEDFGVSGGWGQREGINSDDDDSIFGAIQITKAV